MKDGPEWSGARPRHARNAVRRKEDVMDLHLEGKLALVSGSTAGIGLAIAAALAQEGARVIVNGRTGPTVDSVVAKLKETTGGDILDFAGDLTKATAAEELAQRYRDIAILVNNLGIFEPKPFEEISDADWMRFFDANVLSGVRLSRLFLPAAGCRSPPRWPTRGATVAAVASASSERGGAGGIPIRFRLFPRVWREEKFPSLRLRREAED
jgi:NAD(P)-dependent dehydrogenase (short-subunit alcohol dehydrogenase family)